MTHEKNARIAQSIQMLTAQLDAGKVVSSGPAYDESRRIFNVAVTRRPAVIVLCESTSDVQSSVRAATTCGLSLSVRGGGHDWAGRALRGDLIVDLRRMRRVTIDGRVAIVGGGAPAMAVAEAAHPYGLAAVTGTMGCVGMAGLTLGGGYGPVTGRFGMASDNIVGAEVVLADGRAVRADETHKPDLFWALRGGGGNFGVVTSLRVRLHPLAEVSTGAVTFPWEQARSVFKACDDIVATIPDELTLTPGFLPGADGKPTVVVLHTWCGDRREDERVLDVVKSLGAPSMVQVRRTTPLQMLKDADPLVLYDKNWIIRTVTLARLEPGAVEALIAGMEQRSSPSSWVGLHPFHGVAERIPLESTAFGLRARHFMLGIMAAWERGADAPHRAWADAVEAALKPYALPSAYPNFFGPDRLEQAAQAYGQNTTRLLRIKAHYDPNGVFAATSLPVLAQARAAVGRC
jgi:FAD/FMN-containing dehydrogenase